MKELTVPVAIIYGCALISLAILIQPVVYDKLVVAVGVDIGGDLRGLNGIAGSLEKLGNKIEDQLGQVSSAISRTGGRP